MRKGTWISLWGMAGVTALLVRALVELTPFAVEALTSGALSALQWWVLALWVLGNAYAEGYVGFHRKFSPRTVDRALYLARNPTWARAVLAPVFCLGLFDAGRRTLIASWGILVGIILLVVTVRALPQPWRGIVDAGVVVGLALGLASLLWLYVLALSRGREPSRHDVPAAAA